MWNFSEKGKKKHKDLYCISKWNTPIVPYFSGYLFIAASVYSNIDENNKMNNWPYSDTESRYLY